VAMGVADRPDGRAAEQVYRLVWATLGLFVGGTALGLAWDRGWHASHRFESFWSPPHLFIYTVLGVTTLALAHVARARRLRACLGAGVRVPALPFPLPGALALAAGGLTTIWLGGALDSVWHTAFGLDETGWSLPHATLGEGLLLTFLGLVACRLALVRRWPLAPYSAALLAFLALLFAPTPLGPLGHNHTVAWVAAIARLPVLADQESAQHTFRIYEAWNLTRAHPAFAPLAAFVVGGGLAVAGGLTHRRWLLLLVVLAASLLPLGGDYRVARALGLAAVPGAWLPLPYLPATVALLLARAVRLPEPLSWAAAGLAFGGATAASWGAPPLLALAAGPAMAAGAMAGQWALHTLEAPSARRVGVLLGLLGVGLPLVCGAVDLFLRMHTP